MKRCPDCGFRAKEDIRLCPLCGVRMMYDPNGKAVEKKLHNHTERGEPCFLSDRQAQPPKSRKPEQKQVPKQKPFLGSSGKGKSQSQIGFGVVLVVLYLLLEACSAF